MLLLNIVGWCLVSGKSTSHSNKINWNHRLNRYSKSVRSYLGVKVIYWLFSKADLKKRAVLKPDFFNFMILNEVQADENCENFKNFSIIESSFWISATIFNFFFGGHTKMNDKTAFNTKNERIEFISSNNSWLEEKVNIWTLMNLVKNLRTHLKLLVSFRLEYS